MRRLRYLAAVLVATGAALALGGPAAALPPVDGGPGGSYWPLSGYECGHTITAYSQPDPGNGAYRQVVYGGWTGCEAGPYPVSIPGSAPVAAKAWVTVNGAVVAQAGPVVAGHVSSVISTVSVPAGSLVQVTYLPAVKVPTSYVTPYYWGPLPTNCLAVGAINFPEVGNPGNGQAIPETRQVMACTLTHTFWA